MAIGLTFDTGALIALERNRRRMNIVLAAALQRSAVITVPTVVVAEWWRGQRSATARDILTSVDVEPLSVLLAQRAGEALAVVGGSNTIDAVVMASAASRGDIVYTSDVGDLMKLGQHFPEVRVLAA